MISVTTSTLPFFHIRRIELETTEEVQAISSRNYPADYPNNVDVVFVVTSPEGSHVKLTFLDLVIQDKCSSDNVTISYGKLYYTLSNKCKSADKNKLIERINTIKCDSIILI